MRNGKHDINSCETCNHCVGVHLKKDEKYCRGMLHYCEMHKRIVDKDDVCRKWQKSELLCDYEQEDMSVILAHLKQKYKY